VGEGLHEHDMSALKRIKPKGLRQGAPQGTRVLIVYDKAGIDFSYWDRCRRESAAYFISRVKEHMVFAWTQDAVWDPADPVNRGVFVDCQVQSRDGHHQLRRIMYQDPLTGTVYQFLTNEPDLPPGVIVELYRRRWEAEKVFDEIKNKLGQKKAWATTLEANETQALLIALTHNLLLAYEQGLEARHEIKNTAEDRRRRQRVAAAGRACAQNGARALLARACGPAGHPAQRQVPPLASPCPTRTTRGSRRRDAPQATLCPVMNLAYQHRCCGWLVSTRTRIH